MLLVKKSRIQGNGVFTTKKIPKGTKICTLRGTVFQLKDLKKHSNNFMDPLQIDFTKYIQLNELYRTINHSCKPNTGIRGKNTLFALTTVALGKEITYDYSTTMWEDEKLVNTLLHLPLVTMKCNCHTKNCRKIIKQFYQLPTKLQQKYFTLNAVPDFIARQAYQK